ncbi:MAG: hypothetical protein QOE56_426 [Solirubrobacterales bacterium]|nr:hypothetical protein [Solirubrobacterales bacterium]
MKRLPRLSYANVMVTLLAIAVLGGGVAYAAQHLAKNSVGPRQLRKNSINSAKVKDGSLRAQDFAANQLPAGPQGPRGPQGATGTSHVFQASGSVNFDKFSSSLFGSQVVTLALPPGSYFATATAEVQTVNATASSVTCRLINGNGGPGSAAVTHDQIARADGEVDNMTLAGGFSVTSGQSLNLQCSKSVPASGARIPAASIVAVGVSDVTGLPE